jgi:signal transduction histidine kinase/CheY-like chemotaxis protein
MKVLVADDNRDDAFLLTSWLDQEGHTCARVGDGEAALAHLRRDCPDLIISDILMPKIDGFALCRAVKDDPLWRNIYFVFCTATYTDERDAALALRLGAQRFLTKPIDFERLQALLAEVQAGATQAPPAADAGLSEPVYLQMYNERLVSKLEENHRRLQTVVADLRRQNEKLWALTEANRVFGEAVGVADVEQILVQRALELAQAETALLIILDGDDLIVSRAAGRYGGLLQGLIFPAAGSFCARVAAGGEALTLNQATGGELAAELLLPEAPGSAMLARLRARESNIGLLAVLHTLPGRFEAGALQSFQLLAHQGAIHLENARLIETLRAQADALRHSQDQLVHNARMATVGRLTAALAHEINNPLQSILGSVQFALEQLPADLPQRSYLELAASELDRLGDIVRRMVGFYRRDDDERLPTDINALVRETLALAEKQLQRGRVAVIASLAEDLPRVPLAPNQFKQVFLNLILNAAEAMAGGGNLQVVTRFDGKDQVEISFADNGPGIPAHELDRIFESFYTTKQHGTGLGLSISRDIVARHKGELLAESRPGHGAVFRVLLPCPTN